MSVSIRSGFNVWSTEEARVHTLTTLQAQNFLTLKQELWQICRSCDAPNLQDKQFLSQKSTTCRACGRFMPLTNQTITQYVIEKVNYAKIRRVCEEKLSQLNGLEEMQYKNDQRFWSCKVNGKVLHVFISRYSSYTPYVNSGQSAWLCISIDWERDEKSTHYYNSFHFVKFADLLLQKIDLDSIVTSITSAFPTNPAFQLTKRFDDFIASMEPTDFHKFEGDFVDAFLKGIRERSELLTEYFNFLTLRKQTIANSKTIFLGGAANADFHTIGLLEYIQEGLRPGKVGEVKRYGTSRFTVDDFGKVMLHANGKDTVTVVSTNKISPEVWRTLIDARNTERYYKHVIIDKDTILLLIDALKLDYLLH